VGITDAKKFIGQVCAMKWTDRSGQEIALVSKIHDVTFVPLYGGYLIADTEDIPLDKLTEIEVYNAAPQAQVAA
jgi:hypothetical protein